MINSYIADTVLMVRPIAFGFNEQAAETNAFQSKIDQLEEVQIQQIAELEFDAFVNKLRINGIQVIVFNDNKHQHTPDSIFPNNWFSTCPHTKSLFTYPMKNSNRTAERREDILAKLEQVTGYQLNNELLIWENKNMALEGTGSLVLDHQNKIAYAALSPRTELEIINQWCERTGFKLCAFYAYGPANEHIYHTNVVMTMADDYALIALDTIRDNEERLKVIEHIESAANKKLIDISISQMNQYAGNMLQLQKYSSRGKF